MVIVRKVAWDIPS